MVFKFSNVIKSVAKAVSNVKTSNNKATNVPTYNANKNKTNTKANASNSIFKNFSKKTTSYNNQTKGLSNNKNVSNENSNIFLASNDEKKSLAKNIKANNDSKASIFANNNANFKSGSIIKDNDKKDVFDAVQSAKDEQETRQANNNSDNKQCSTNGLVDPIGIQDNTTKTEYHFIIDDGAFDSTNDFLGAGSGIAALAAIDTSGDNLVSYNELSSYRDSNNNPLGVIATKSDGSWEKMTLEKLDAETGLGDFSIDLSSVNLNNNGAYKSDQTNIPVVESSSKSVNFGFSAYSTYKKSGELSQAFGIKNEMPVVEDFPFDGGVTDTQSTNEAQTTSMNTDSSESTEATSESVSTTENTSVPMNKTTVKLGSVTDGSSPEIEIYTPFTNLVQATQSKLNQKYFQKGNSMYSGKCYTMSTTFASDLTGNKHTYTYEHTANCDNLKQSIERYLSNGIPVVVEVSAISDSNTDSRHYVTAVGKTADGKIVAWDPYDGNYRILDFETNFDTWKGCYNGNRIIRKDHERTGYEIAV